MKKLKIIEEGILDITSMNQLKGGATQKEDYCSGIHYVKTCLRFEFCSQKFISYCGEKEYRSCFRYSASDTCYKKFDWSGHTSKGLDAL